MGRTSANDHDRTGRSPAWILCVAAVVLAALAGPASTSDLRRPCRRRRAVPLPTSRAVCRAPSRRRRSTRWRGTWSSAAATPAPSAAACSATLGVGGIRSLSATTVIVTATTVTSPPPGETPSVTSATSPELLGTLTATCVTRRGDVEIMWRTSGTERLTREIVPPLTRAAIEHDRTTSFADREAGQIERAASEGDRADGGADRAAAADERALAALDPLTGARSRRSGG